MSYFVEVCTDVPLKVGDLPGLVPSLQGESDSAPEAMWYQFNTDSLETAQKIRAQAKQIDPAPELVRIFEVITKTVEEHKLLTLSVKTKEGFYSTKTTFTA